MVCGPPVAGPPTNEGTAPVTKAEERGLERLILFSDAVVAIAITLLVLPLTAELEVPGEGGDLMHEVLSEQGLRTTPDWYGFPDICGDGLPAWHESHVPSRGTPATIPSISS